MSEPQRRWINCVLLRTPFRPMLVLAAAITVSTVVAQAKSGNRAGHQPVVNTKPDTSVSKRSVKRKQPPAIKTPSPGGPVPIPYPN
jgi:hypothetical protein